MPAYNDRFTTTMDMSPTSDQSLSMEWSEIGIDRRPVDLQLGVWPTAAVGGVIGALLAIALYRARAGYLLSSTWTLRDIDAQFNRALNQGWLPHFEAAANTSGFDQALLMGIASRETNIRNIVGDGGHGHGIMQIDDRSYPEFVRSGDAMDPRKNILKGAEILGEKRNEIRGGVGRNLRCRSSRSGRYSYFKGAELTELGLLRTSIAAYNAGCWPYYAISTYGNPDQYTTGADYSTDVLNRAEAFARLL